MKPAKSPEVQIYDLAVEHNLPTICEVRVPTSDYREQPTLWGAHVVRSEIARRDISQYAGSDLSLYVAGKDRASILFLSKLAESAKLGQTWHIKKMIPRATLVEILYGQYRMLEEDYGGIPWGESFNRLTRSLGVIGSRLEEGDADMGEIFKGLSDAQSDRNNRTAAFINEAEYRIAHQRYGMRLDKLVNDLALPTSQDHHQSREQRRMACAKGQLFGVTQNKPRADERLSVYVQQCRSTVKQGKRGIDREIKRYVLYIGPKEVEVFSEAKEAFLRRERLLRDRKDQQAA